MKLLILSLIATLAILTGPGINHAAAQPPNNSSTAFCIGRAPGYYCQPADALHVIQCPGGIATACPNGTFCDFVGQVGPVPALQCAPPITLNYCKNNVTNSPNYGQYCISGPGIAYNGYMDCSNGKLTRCNYGSYCLEGLPGQASCVPVSPIISTTVISSQPPLSCTGTTVISSTVNCQWSTPAVITTSIPLTLSGSTTIVVSNSTTAVPCFVTTTQGACVHFASQCTLNSVQQCSTSISPPVTVVGLIPILPSLLPPSLLPSLVPTLLPTHLPTLSPTLLPSIISSLFPPHLPHLPTLLPSLSLNWLRSICSRLPVLPDLPGEEGETCPQKTVSVVSYVTRYTPFNEEK